MNKILKWILSIVAGIVSILGILIIVLIVIVSRFGELGIQSYYIGFFSFVISALTGWFSVRTIYLLKHPDIAERIQAEKKEKKQQKSIEQEKKQSAIYEQERLKKEAKYSQYRANKDRQEELLKQIEEAEKIREKELSEDDIEKIYRPNRKGPAYFLSILSYILVAVFLVGSVYMIMNFKDLFRHMHWKSTALFCIVWYICLVLLFVLASIFLGMYKQGQLQVFVRTRMHRLYYFVIIPSYVNPSSSISKWRQMIENSYGIQRNKEIHKAACEYLNSDEFVTCLSDCIHRKTAMTEYRMKYYYLEDYKVRKGILNDCFYYKDETASFKKLNVYKSTDFDL